MRGWLLRLLTHLGSWSLLLSLFQGCVKHQASAMIEAPVRPWSGPPQAHTFAVSCHLFSGIFFTLWDLLPCPLWVRTLLTGPLLRSHAPGVEKVAFCGKPAHEGPV